MRLPHKYNTFIHDTRTYMHMKPSNQDGHHYGDKETTIIVVSRAPAPHAPQPYSHFNGSN